MDFSCRYYYQVRTQVVSHLPEPHPYTCTSYSARGDSRVHGRVNATTCRNFRPKYSRTRVLYRETLCLEYLGLLRRRAVCFVSCQAILSSDILAACSQPLDSISALALVVSQNHVNVPNVPNFTCLTSVSNDVLQGQKGSCEGACCRTGVSYAVRHDAPSQRDRR